MSNTEGLFTCKEIQPNIRPIKMGFMATEGDINTL